MNAASVGTGSWLPWAATAARVVLAAVFAWAGIAKMADPDAAVRAVRAYRLLPETLVRLAAWGLPFIELVLAVLLLAGIATRLSAGVGFALLAGFLLAIGSAWARGLQIDCGCFGGGGPAHASAGRYVSELARDALLLVIAGGLLLRPASRLALLDLTEDR